MFVVVKLFILFFYEFKIKVVVVSVYIVFIGNIMFGVIKMLFYFGLSVCQVSVFVSCLYYILFIKQVFQVFVVCY